MAHPHGNGMCLTVPHEFYYHFYKGWTQKCIFLYPSKVYLCFLNFYFYVYECFALCIFILPWDWNCRWLWATKLVLGIKLRPPGRATGVLTAEPSFQSRHHLLWDVLVGLALSLTINYSSWCNCPCSEFLTLSRTYCLHYEVVAYCFQCVRLLCCREHGGSSRLITHGDDSLGTIIYVRISFLSLIKWIWEFLTEKWFLKVWLLFYLFILVKCLFLVFFFLV